MKPKHSSDQQEGKRAVTSEGGPTKRLRFEMPETEGNTQVNEGYMDLSLNDLNNIKSLRQSKRKEFALASWEDSGDCHETAVDDPSLFKTRSGDSPIMEPFSMAKDMKYGKFDAEGYFQFSKKRTTASDSDDDEEDVTDPWLESLNENVGLEERSETVVCRPVANASSEPSAGALAEEALDKKETRDLLMSLISFLETSNETPAAALRRCKTKTQKDATQSNNKLTSPKPGKVSNAKMDPESRRLFESITEHCNVLMLSRGYHDILSMGRYALLRKIERIAQSDNKATTQQDGALGYSCSQKRSEDTAFWQFRYRSQGAAGKPSDTGEVHGPYTTHQMQQWIHQGYFSESNPAEIREVTKTGEPTDGVWHFWTTLKNSVCKKPAAGEVLKAGVPSSSDEGGSVDSDEEPDFGT